MEPPCCFVTSRNALFNRHAMYACQLFIADRAHPRDCGMWAHVWRPSPPKFNVAFYILLFAFYPTSVIWHPSLHFRHSTFLVQHSSFCLVHSPFRTQYSSSRSSSAGCTFKFSHSMLSICQSSFCFQHLTLRISLASLHCTFNFLNCTFHPLIIHQG